MKLLFLTSGRRTPSTRFRMIPLVKYLRASGHRCTLAHSFPEKYEYFPRLGFRPSQWLKRSLRRLDLMRARLGRYDAVILERELFDTPDWTMESRLRHIATTLVLDIDDGVFLRFPEKFDYLLAASDLVIAGNPLLEQWALKGNPHVIEIPTCIDTAEYRPRRNGPEHLDRLPVIGWMGTSGNIAYLQTLAAPLRRLAASHDFEFRVVSSHRATRDDLQLDGVRVAFRTWSPKTETSDVQDFDIGVMPLTDDRWSRYKCGLKLLQYMSVGVPGVASPVGVNRDIITSGVNGYLASNGDQWHDALARLLSSPDVRRTMGKQALATVQRDYSVAGHLPRWIEAVERTIARTGRHG